MALEILERASAERRRSTIGWVIGAAIYTFASVAVYPSVRHEVAVNALVAQYPKAMLALLGIDPARVDLTSSVGFVSSQLTFVGPLLLIMVGVAFGAATLAGEEQSGVLLLLLSAPVTRRRVVLEKAVAVVIGVVAVGAALFVAIEAGRVFGVEIPAGRLAAFCGALALLGMLFGSIALAAGAVTGSRAFATGSAAALAGGTYLVSSLAPVVDAVRPLRWGSPFWYATGSNPLSAGLAVRDVAVLLGLTGLALVVAVAGFDRRDLQN